MATLLTAVRGIGPAAAKNLTNHGITSVEELASISVAILSQVPGYSTVLSQRIIADARALLADSGVGSAASDDQKLVVLATAGPGGSGDRDSGKERPAGKAMAGSSKNKKSGKKKRKTNKQETRMSKKSDRKAKSLKKEIKARNSKISRQDKKIKRLKKELKKIS
jgi:predicted flap endonuclease-1-like 5' DNA nuclease